MPDPITPTLPDPQASVDAALGSLPPTPVAPAPVMNAPMGDETPLAFAAPTLNAMPITPTPTPAPVMPSAPVSPIAPEAPKLEPMPSVGSSYLPPVPPAPISTPPVEDKPKKKSKVMLVVIGIFAMLGVLGVGGYFAYQQYVTQNTIAAVDQYDDEASCVNNCDGGHKLIWATRNGKTGCYWSTKLCDNGGGGGGTGSGGTGPVTRQDDGSCKYANGVGYGFFCGGCVDRCVATSEFGAGEGCNAFIARTCGGSTTTGGAQCTTDAATASKNGWTKECGKGGVDNTGYNNDACGGKTVYFSVNGFCTHPVAGGKDDGLCALYPGCESGTSTGGGGTTVNDYTCDSNGCSVNTFDAANCYVQRYSCSDISKDYSGGCQESKEGPAKSFTFNKTCGVQQIDVHCKGNFNFVSKENAQSCGVTPPPENPVTHKACNTTTKVCETVTGPGADTCATDANCVTAAPVLACTGLTNTPAAPVIGQTVTFTCAGTITPTGAATLSYKFKYSLNDGADQLLANKTNTTAELAITACGTYSVQCKVCATIAGVLKCDPTWTGAIQ